MPVCTFYLQVSFQHTGEPARPLPPSQACMSLVHAMQQAVHCMQQQEHGEVSQSHFGVILVYALQDTLRAVSWDFNVYL